MEIRSFIAIELPPQFRLGLRELQAKLKPENRGPAKWVDPDSIHLTLRFLGNIGEDRLSAITRAIATATAGIPPFCLKTGRIGAFPNLKRVQVVWVGLDGDLERLLELKQRLDSELKPLGFPAEERTFTPHLTLARLRQQASALEREQMGRLISDIGLERVYQMSVTSLSLMRSHLTREGAIHHQISSIALLPLSKTET